MLIIATKKRFGILLLALLLVTVSGCSSLGYYFDAVNGHLSVLAEQQAIKDILQESDVTAELKAKLTLATQARDFASAEMKLPDNDSYRYYSDIKRPYVVWNVIATKPFSIKAKQWCFLVVGCVSYRGYFNKDDADNYAKSLKVAGYDVNVAGAKAYSTLGWLDDPLLNTMIQYNEARLVGLIIHELAHQQIYIDNDSSFNEAFASSVELEGVKRWFNRQTATSVIQSNFKSYQDYLVLQKRELEFKQLLKSTQQQLQDLFNSDTFKTSNKQKLLKAAVYNELQQNYRALKKSWQGYAGYDAWMKRDLNNAHLALVATYYDKVPAFQAILRSVNNNIENYYQTVEEIGGLSEPERNRRLNEYQKNNLVNEPGLRIRKIFIAVQKYYASTNVRTR